MGSGTRCSRWGVVMARRVNAAAPTTNVKNSFRVPGAYEYALAKVVHEAIEDPYWALSDECCVPELDEQHKCEEATLVAAEIELRRGQPVLCQNRQLPTGVRALFKGFSAPWRCGFTVDPDDMVTLRPPPQ